MLRSDIIKRYPWYEQHELKVFAIASRLNMNLRDVLETLDKMLGERRHTPKAFTKKAA